MPRLLEVTSDGYRLWIHATPGPRRNHVSGQHDGRLRVSVTAAEKGQANQAINKLLAHVLKLKPRQFDLETGETSRRKVFLITNPPSELQQRVADLATID